jgi:hypothetical protein
VQEMFCSICECEIDERKLSKEHVPPKMFFLPGANNLITVTCCKSCNNSKGKDDEYVWQMMAMSKNLDFRPEFNELAAKATRVLGKENKVWFTKSIVDSSYIIPRYDCDDEGLYDVDINRITNWINIVSKSLVTGKMGMRGYRSRFTLYLNGIVNIDGQADLVKKMIKFTRDNSGVSIGVGEFPYWVYEKDGKMIIIQCYYKEHYFSTLLECT